MRLSGGEDKETVFVFTEFKTNEEFYYQDIDALLISGEVPNLFVNEELQDVLEVGFSGTKGHCFFGYIQPGIRRQLKAKSEPFLR